MSHSSWVLTTHSHTDKMVSSLIQTKVLQPEHLARIVLGTKVGRQVVLETFASTGNPWRILSKKLPPRNLEEVAAVLKYLETANARTIRELFKRIGCPMGRYFGAPIPFYTSRDDLAMVCFCQPLLFRIGLLMLSRRRNCCWKPYRIQAGKSVERRNRLSSSKPQYVSP